MAKHEFQVPAEAAGLRLDQVLGRYVPGLSRRSARVALDMGAVFVDQRRVKVASRTLAAGQHIAVHLGGAFDRAVKRVGQAARAQDSAHLPAYRVCFEDEHLVVVDKPAGLLTAPTPEGDSGNLQQLLAQRQQPAAPIYVVQRLDLHTSGVLVFAKTELANARLGELFRSHSLTRRYDAFAEGSPAEESFTVDQRLSGKTAITHFRLLARYERFCHLEATLETGRTHQIRRHLQSRGLGVLADLQHAGRAPWHPPRLALHAKLLRFQHPISEQSLSFELPLPEDLALWLAAQARP